LNAESQGFLIKCIKVIGEKRESRRWFSLTKGSNCLKRLMIWTGWSDLFWCFWLSNRNYGVLQYSKNVWCTQNNGVLVTYAARGVVKRSMIEVGFKVEKLAGPQREMFAK
jgi:hypothetical protein